MKALLIAICFFCFSSLAWGQAKTTDVKDIQKAKELLEVYSGGTLKVDGYSIRHISNDPALGDSSNIDLVTEAAVVAYVQAYVAAQGDNQTAAQVSFTPTGSIAATNVQTALAEVDAEKLATSSLLSTLLTVDGSGSGLDADLLDGQSGSYYQDASNLSAGTLALARLPFGTANQLLRTNAGGTAAEWFTPSYLTSEVDGNTTNELQNLSYTSSTRAVAISNGSGFTFPIMTSTEAGLAPLSGGGTANFLRADGSWAAPPGGTTINSTNGYLPYRTAPSAFGDSPIFTDGTSVGLGTTNPYAKLSFGSVYVSTDYPDRIRLYDDGTSGGANSYGFGINGSTGKLNYFAGAGGTHSFFSNSVELMTILGSGAVGINATSPLSPLHVKVATDKNFRVRQNTELSIAAINDANSAFVPMYFEASHVAITQGDFSIGTTSHTEKLHLSGNFLLTGVIKNADGSAAAPAYTFTNDLDVGVFRPTTNTLGFAVGGTEYARLSSAGLQLGTAGATQGNLLLAGSSSGTVTVKGAAAAGTWTLTLPTSGGSSGYALTTDGSGGTTWTQMGTLTGSGSSGRIAYWNGIGSLTSASSFLFDGTNFTTTNPMYVSASGSASAPSIAFSGDADNGWWRPSADVQAWSTNGTERLRLSASSLTSSNVGNVDWVASSQWSAFVGARGMFITSAGVVATTDIFSLVNPLGTGTAAAEFRLYEDNDNPTPNYVSVTVPTITANYAQTMSAATGEIGVWLRGSGTIDFPSTGVQSQSESNITVTGAAVGDAVVVGVPNNIQGIFTAYVSATNTVTVRYSNTAATSLDPASGTFIVHVKK